MVQTIEFGGSVGQITNVIPAIPMGVLENSSIDKLIDLYNSRMVQQLDAMLMASIAGMKKAGVPNPGITMTEPNEFKGFLNEFANRDPVGFRREAIEVLSRPRASATFDMEDIVQ